jgi:23S rRNA pseudouridine2605 synthase
LSSAIDFSAGQLAAARATAWHQDGKALLTLDAMRAWVDHYGLVLFAPRAAQLGAPAPSFIEATLGIANEAPTAAESATARSLAARLVAEGTALPLNLLGSAGDQPDFIASAKVFSYVFTMRGDKAWKQPPSTSEGNKVSPLAVRVWEVLGEKGALSASELASELGREVTKTAITRALNELWSQLRVIPQHQQDENSPVLWELTSKRFAKAIKAGTNAGQPKAMSALLSLYLAQAVGATEEEVAGFLSPLTARSRVREIVHALTAGRQLDTTVVDGKTLLHVSGTLPEFAPEVKPPVEEGTEPGAEPAKKVGTGRIARFTGGADKPRSDFKGKPASGASPRERSNPRGGRPSSSRSGGPRPSRPIGSPEEISRRPFQRADSKPTFTKPWEEDKRPRLESAEGEAPRERKPKGEKPAYSPKEFGERKSFDKKPKPNFVGDRKPYGERTYGGSNSVPRKTFGDKPAFGERKSFGDKPASGERKPYERKSFGDKPASGERKPYERKSFGDKPAFGAKKTYGDKPSFGAKKSYGDRPARPRPDGGSEGFKPRERSAYPPRDGGRPNFGGRASWGAGPSRPAPEGGFNRADAFKSDDMPPARSYERKPYAPRAGGDARPPRKTFGDKPAYGPKKTYGDRRSFSSDRPARPRPDGDSRPPRPGGFAKKPFGSKPSFGSKPAFGSKPRFGGGKPSFGAVRTGGKPSFGAKPSRPYVKREGGTAPVRRKPESEE